MITKINQVIRDYFENNPDVSIIRAKVLMPQFIKAGIFTKDYSGGLPIRKKLRNLDSKNQLDLIPYVRPERKTKNTYWYFNKNLNN